MAPTNFFQLQFSVVQAHVWMQFQFFFLLRFLRLLFPDVLRGGAPVPYHLKCDEGIAGRSHDERPDQHGVVGLLDAGEDSGQAARGQQEHGHRRELTRVAVTVVGEGLHQLMT